MRRRNVPLTEEVLNKLNANQLAGVDNYHQDSIYDMEAIWDEKVAARNMKVNHALHLTHLLAILLIAASVVGCPLKGGVDYHSKYCESRV